MNTRDFVGCEFFSYLAAKKFLESNLHPKEIKRMSLLH